MNPSNQNPLSKHFRQPAIYIRLPSRGKYWPEGSLELPVNSELPVYPMTTRDEITLKTPDALLNGAGMISVIESCCPSIKQGWDMPTVDLDTVLISIRIASFGHVMSTETNCPSCSENNNYDIDLRTALDSIQMPDYDQPEVFEDLKIFVRPQDFKTSNKISMLNFEEQKILQAINNQDLSDEQKAVTVTKQLYKVIDITSDMLTASTEKIHLDDGTVVTDPEFIREFYQNSKSSINRAVQKRLEDLSEQAAIKPFQVSCASCNFEFKMNVDFNYSSFFATGF
jgi:hypothetical protein